MNSNQTAGNNFSPAMQHALRLVEAGKTVEAEETVLAAADAARNRFGAGSTEDASAQNDLASILISVGQVDRAIKAFEEAVSGPAPTDSQAVRDRLTYLMSLGQALQIACRPDDAEQVLHKGLEGRETFYGREHPGYAFGLEPLSEVTFKLGKTDAALAMVNEVVANFWRNGHARVAGAIALRAGMLKAAGKSAPVFGSLDKLPNEVITEIARNTIARVAKSDDLKISRGVLSDLIVLLSARLGESHAQTVNALIALSNVERKLGKESDPRVRQTTILRLIGIFDEQKRPRDALQSSLALALAHSDAGEDEQAIKAYESAVERAEALADAREKSQVLRNFGLLLVELKRAEAAEPRLRDAIAEGEKSGDREMIGRAMIALGIFLQHGGRLDEARKYLAAALPMLDPAHPDALTGRSHLQAIDSKGSCGCGDMSGAIADAFGEFVMSRAPAGLLEKLDVTLKDQNFSIGVHLARTPTEEELRHLHRVTEHALEEFKRRMGTER